ncbi:MAG: LuxR C-terminal-related transcriptional regulator [Trebonia sp.]|uniref:LuxR C-terminal-related transcriptional regulator n=1 Tax=Trebonia sp. TaxID=2767075 RepID=UPI003C74782E
MKREVIDGFQAVSGRNHLTAPGLAFALIESKFHPPGVRPGIVVRTALVERLAATRVPVITVAAPPGYGKTTLMSQWAERIGSRAAWLSCDDGDNDPVVLLSALAVALDRIGRVDPSIFSALASAGADITVVPRFVSAVSSVQPPVTVLLDQAEAVTNRQCLNTIAEFALRLPPGWQLGLASRTVVPLPTARLRAQGGILEVTADDLSMGPREADSLLKGAGVEADEASVRDLLQRTEGWPAGLYIAALAIKSGSRNSDVGFTFTGDDVYMGDYLRSELLDRISGAEASFLIRTSVLDRMCGSLCDAILEETGSTAVLEQMEARNLLVIPLDRHREWYRYHHLLRDLMRAELRRREPDLIQDLNFRAAAWFEANAMPEAAIDHAQAAGDYDRVARLILELQQPVWASGRVETVLRWMDWLRDIPSAEYYGAIAVHGSLIFALLGQPAEAERWAAAAERASPGGVLPDGSTMEATLAYLRAILCRTGIGEMRRDARIAWEGLSPASPYRATMLYTEGISYLLEGDLARAEPILARALDLATQAGSLPLAGMILAEQCGVAAERDDWPEVTTLARRAATIVETGHFGDYWTSALVYAWASRASAYQGDVGQARFYLGRASRLRPLLTYALPVVSVQALLEMTRSYIALADPEGAAAVLAQVHDILQQRPDLGVLPELAGQLQASLATANARAVSASSLTAAELRLLPLLATHLSYQEIGERLFVSKNTVKTQAYSAYRKLRVSSRSEAVVRTRELGLDAV